MVLDPIDRDPGTVEGRTGIGWIEQWVTVHTISTCERCEALHGAWLLEGEGPAPVVNTHHGCRCRRVRVQRMEDLQADARIVAALRLSGGRAQAIRAMQLSTRSKGERDAAAAAIEQERINTRGAGL